MSYSLPQVQASTEFD